jgi:hypothetical protein
MALIVAVRGSIGSFCFFLFKDATEAVFVMVFSDGRDGFFRCTVAASLGVELGPAKACRTTLGTAGAFLFF